MDINCWCLTLSSVVVLTSCSVTFFPIYTCLTKKAIDFVLANAKLRSDLFTTVGWVVIRSTDFSFYFSTRKKRLGFNFFVSQKPFHAGTCCIQHTSHNFMLLINDESMNF